MRTLIFLSLCSALPAQVGGPLIGYVPEGAHIRPMYGLPAAGAIGAAARRRAQFRAYGHRPQSEIRAGLRPRIRAS